MQIRQPDAAATAERRDCGAVRRRHAPPLPALWAALAALCAPARGETPDFEWLDTSGEVYDAAIADDGTLLLSTMRYRSPIKQPAVQQMARIAAEWRTGKVDLGDWMYLMDTPAGVHLFCDGQNILRLAPDGSWSTLELKPPAQYEVLRGKVPWQFGHDPSERAWEVRQRFEVNGVYEVERRPGAGRLDELHAFLLFGLGAGVVATDGEHLYWAGFKHRLGFFPEVRNGQTFVAVPSFVPEYGGAPMFLAQPMSLPPNPHDVTAVRWTGKGWESLSILCGIPAGAVRAAWSWGPFRLLFADGADGALQYFRVGEREGMGTRMPFLDEREQPLAIRWEAHVRSLPDAGPPLLPNTTGRTEGQWYRFTETGLLEPFPADRYAGTIVSSRLGARGLRWVTTAPDSYGGRRACWVRRPGASWQGVAEFGDLKAALIGDLADGRFVGVHAPRRGAWLEVFAIRDPGHSEAVRPAFAGPRERVAAVMLNADRRLTVVQMEKRAVGPTWRYSLIPWRRGVVQPGEKVLLGFFDPRNFTVLGERGYLTFNEPLTANDPLTTHLVLDGCVTHGPLARVLAKCPGWRDALSSPPIWSVTLAPGVPGLRATDEVAGVFVDRVGRPWVARGRRVLLGDVLESVVSLLKNVPLGARHPDFPVFGPAWDNGRFIAVRDEPGTSNLLGVIECDEQGSLEYRRLYAPPTPHCITKPGPDGLVGLQVAAEHDVPHDVLHRLALVPIVLKHNNQETFLDWTPGGALLVLGMRGFALVKPPHWNGTQYEGSARRELNLAAEHLHDFTGAVDAKGRLWVLHTRGLLRFPNVDFGREFDPTPDLSIAAVFDPPPEFFIDADGVGWGIRKSTSPWRELEIQRIDLPAD